MDPQSNHSWMSDSNYGGTEKNTEPRENLHYGESGQNMKNDLPVHPSPADEDLRARIIESLRDKLELGPGEIGVDVHFGHVLLTGTVPSHHLRIKAETLVEETEGVSKVTSDLWVSTQ